MFSHMLHFKYALDRCLLCFIKDENLEDEMTNPVLIIDDLDYAAMFVFHGGRGHRLFWLHWLCGFLLQLLLRNKMNKNTNSYSLFLIVFYFTQNRNRKKAQFRISVSIPQLKRTAIKNTAAFQRLMLRWK